MIAELYVARKKLLQFFQDIKSSEETTLTVYAQALLFQDEVEESLSEPWHCQSYILIRDRSAPILVESLNYPVVGTLPLVHVQDDHEDHSITANLTAVQTKSRDELRQKGDEVAKELLGLKRAVWLLAAAIVLAAVIT